MTTYSPSIEKLASTLGESLSEYRRIYRIPASQLAQRAGVSRDTITRLEAGDPGVSLGTVLTVARIFGIEGMLLDSVDPASTEYGRQQMKNGIVKRVRQGS